MQRRNEPALARRRYELNAGRTDLPSLFWTGLAVRLWKAARLATGEYSRVLVARAIDCEERASKLVAARAVATKECARCRAPHDNHGNHCSLECEREDHEVFGERADRDLDDVSTTWVEGEDVELAEVA